jgi:AraC-like DNA-binding protein
MKALALEPGRVPAEAGPAQEYPTLELISRVRQARLHAGDTRREAGKVLAMVSGTTVKVTSTSRQTFRLLEQRRRAVRGSVAARERVIRPDIAVAAIPDDAPAGPAGTRRPESSPATLRRAVAFIDEHAGQDLTAADIAAASFVTVRAVQLAFRRYMGTTPREYLRQVRLERAHRDLVAADPARDSVTAVAYRWGFASPSRFASYYHRAYGITPSHTLHSCPGRLARMCAQPGVGGADAQPPAGDHDDAVAGDLPLDADRAGHGAA